MKVLLLNGSPHPHGCTATALDEMIGVFEAEGVETKLVQVGKEAVRGCVSCGACAEQCPVSAISEGDGKYEIDADACLSCGACAEVCPVGAPAEE